MLNVAEPNTPFLSFTLYICNLQSTFHIHD